MSVKEVDIKPRAAEVNEDTVALLEGMLEKAKSGAVQEVLIVGIMSDKSIGSCYTPTVDFIARLGAIEHIKLRWMHEHILHDGQDPERF